MDLDTSLNNQSEAMYHFIKKGENSIKHFIPDSIYLTKEELVYDLIFDVISLNLRNKFIQISLHKEIIFRSANILSMDIHVPKDLPEGKGLFYFTDKSLSPDEIRASYYKKDGFDILVAYPLTLINRNLENLSNLYLIILPLFLLLSIIGGTLLSIGSLSRINKIIKRTDEITTSNLNEIIEGQEIDDEYGRLIKTLNQMIARIRTSIDYMNQFSIDVSHELKTPLTILRGEIEIALRHPKTAEEYKKVLQSNYEETLQLINIVDRLFFLSILDHNLFKLKMEPINASELLLSLANQMKPLARQRNINIVFEGVSEVKLLVDIELMRRAITNLIANAIKYGNENTSVNLTAGMTSAGQAYIAVNNKGRTIPRELHEKIFERFYRSESSRNIEPGGIGLGLSIAKSIILINNGKIWVESNAKEGTTFWITLDLYK